MTGAAGRLGRALLAAAESMPDMQVAAWRRVDYDLDEPDTVTHLLERDKPDLVVHAAAWTDVDGCAREPALAMRRNSEAVDGLARRCVERGTSLLLVSTNEVFDGRRTDGRGYSETDATAPPNPYGASKLAGEEAARATFGGRDGLWIVRTAWLYGPPGDDFPRRILAAADRLDPDQALPVVVDEHGSPSFTRDAALAMLRLPGLTRGGLYHLVNEGVASRLEWAQRVLARLRPGRSVRPISAREFVRASRPPAWAVLDGTRAAEVGLAMRDWRDALDEFLEELEEA